MTTTRGFDVNFQKQVEPDVIPGTFLHLNILYAIDKLSQRDNVGKPL